MLSSDSKKNEASYPSDLAVFAKILLVYPAIGFVVIAFAAVFYAMTTHVTRIVDRKLWPAALRQIAEASTEPSIEYVTVQSGFEGFGGEERSFARIVGKKEVASLIALAELQPADERHPRKVDFESCQKRVGWSLTGQSEQWYSTPGFGIEHQECIDLYLLLTNPEHDEALVYRYWVF